MPEDTGNPAIKLRIPEAIGVPLLKAAKKRQCTVQTIVLEILANHFAVSAPPPSRGRPAKIPVE